ncbi:MarC family protein [soil metagenome]
MIAPVDYGVLAFSSLLAMVNPLEAAPLFVAATQRHETRRREIAVRASMAAGIAMVLFAVGGGAMFAFFGITVPAFQIAGGLLFLITGLRHLNGGHEAQASSEADDPSIVPLGIPTLAGAGTLSTVMVLAGQAPTPWHKTALGIAILLNVALAMLALLTAPLIVRRLGPAGGDALGRVMGLLAAVLGVQFVINGVTAVVHGLR